MIKNRILNRNRDWDLRHMNGIPLQLKLSRLTQTKRMSCFLSGLTSPNKYAVVKSRAKNKISSKTTKNVPSNLSDSIINIHNNDHNSANSGRLSNFAVNSFKNAMPFVNRNTPDY